MYINITDSEKGNNKGSSGDLVHYLDKENRLYKSEEPELWFNDHNQNIQSYEVKYKLDNNIAKLCRDDAKFFLINISPSQKEIAHLNDLYGRKQAREKFKAYAIKMMDEYAQNFKKEAIRSNTDLLWFGKIENYRYYSHKDREVKSGEVKRGTVKSGEHLHIQVIVSRKDMTNKIRLSPMNKSRGKNIEHSKKLGQFDRVAFKNAGERVFDQAFDFQRPISETFEHAKANQKGLKERLATSRQQPSLKQETEKTYLQAQEPTHYLDILLQKQDNQALGTGFRKRKKRRKNNQQQQGLNL